MRLSTDASSPSVVAADVAADTSLEEYEHDVLMSVPTLEMKNGLGAPSPRGRSRNPKSSYDTDHELDQSIEVVQSPNGETDDIIDIEERYCTEDGLSQLVEELSPLPDARDDIVAEDSRDGTISCEASALSFSSSVDENPSFEEQEHYLDKLIGQFGINDMIRNFQEGTIQTIAKAVQEAASVKRLAAAESNDTCDTTSVDERRQRSCSRSRHRMEAELKREIRIADRLERELDAQEQEFEEKLAAQNQKIETLESKLRLQEQIFESQLEAEREKWEAHTKQAEIKDIGALQESIQNLEDKVEVLSKKNSLLQAGLNHESKEKAKHERALVKMAEARSNEVKLLQEAIRALEGAISEINDKNSWLQAALDKESARANSVIAEVEKLEDQVFIIEEELDNERTERMKREVHCNKIEFLFEIEQRKVRALELSEAQAQLQLLTEQKRCQSTNQMNERLKANKSPTKKSTEDNISDARVMELQLLLKEKDEQLALIKGILGKSSPEK